jgi:hypothetical protein
VDQSGAGDFTDIPEAVSCATADDTVLVAPGVYQVSYRALLGGCVEDTLWFEGSIEGNEISSFYTGIDGWLQAPCPDASVISNHVHDCHDGVALITCSGLDNTRSRTAPGTASAS